MNLMSSEDPLRIYLDAAREGDNVALRELVLRTQSAVGSVCRALGSHSDGEDLTQETYLRAFRSLESFRGEAPVHVWLLSIARRVCVDHIRSQTRRRALKARLEQQFSPQAESVAGLYGDVFRLKHSC
jgi:RNA polymerase sigma-70 factor, ECF subfamily